MRLRIRILIAIIICFVFCIGCAPYLSVPEDGVWYCEELQIQLSFERDIGCFAIINGDKIFVIWQNDRGSEELSVICQQTHPDYHIGESIFCAKIVSLDEQEFIVYDERAQKEYVFYRIE